MSINGITGSEIRSDSKFGISVHETWWHTQKSLEQENILSNHPDILTVSNESTGPSWKYRLATEHSANAVKHPRTLMESHNISQLGSSYSLTVTYKCIPDKSENGWCQLYLYNYWHCGWIHKKPDNSLSLRNLFIWESESWIREIAKDT